MHTDGSDFDGMKNLTFSSGTYPFGPGSQLCINISVVDDEIIEGMEKFVLCAYYEGTSEVILQNSGCTDIYIEDNDGMEAPIDYVFPSHLLVFNISC